MNLLFFKINNVHISSISSNSILQACFFASIDIPRFCYHEGLRIAGNCRMCLVEVSSSKKLVASCATPIINGLDIKTTTLRVKRARQSVLEFLLINHPLDCPICDQGGECDLQDITLVFGGDRGRFFEISKRSVFDKNLGPLIKTIMNRCIHCTRCVRFFLEINTLNLVRTKVPLLGLFGRGSNTEIGTYIPQIFLNEFSGNVIDLCPVGALTSKPFSFKARVWELTAAFTFDVFDNMLPRIRLDMSGSNILRVLPYSNINNFSWISNKSRYYFDFLENIREENFSFLNLQSNKFMIKSIKIHLEDSLYIISNLFLLHLNTQIISLLGSILSLESFFIFKEFFISLGISTIFLDLFFINKNTYTLNNESYDFRESFSLNFDEKLLFDNLWVIFNIGLNLRMEAPLLFLQILKLYKLNQIKLLTFNALNYNNIYKNQNQTNISIKLLFQFFESRHIQNRVFYKYFVFYKGLLLLPENNILNNFNTFSLINFINKFKEHVFEVFIKKYIFITSPKNLNALILMGIIQKNTSNLTFFEIGIPYITSHLLKNFQKSSALLLTVDTSNIMFKKILKKFKEQNINITSILFSMNIFDTDLLNKVNLIIPVANIYQTKESYLNIFLETKMLNKIHTTNFYNLNTIFQAITAYIILKYNSKIITFYNSFFYASLFVKFKKLRENSYFYSIINWIILPTIYRTNFSSTILLFFFIYLSVFNNYIITTYYSNYFLTNYQHNNYILMPNNLNFYVDIRSDVFITSKVILKSSIAFKKEYNFISFSLSI